MLKQILRHRKHGGLNFISIGRLTVSWSVKRKPSAPPQMPARLMGHPTFGGFW